MNVQSLLIRLQSWMQQEIAVQTNLAEALAAQEAAVRAGDAQGLTGAAERLETLLAGHTGRERQRLDLLSGFARALDRPAKTLTIADLAEHARSAGLDPATVLVLRDELRERVQRVRTRARRLITLARYHGEVLADVLRLLGRVEGGAATPTEGVLIDAEA